jgi:hypothetical protein
MPNQVKFSVSPLRGDRIHYVNEEDVRVLLGRMPDATWSRLRAVHFNDESRGGRILGYVTRRGRSEISVCALPPRVGLTRALRLGQTPEQFGARSGRKWPVLAVRRFMLYDVFLHELGHLQLIYERSSSGRLRYADEKLAQEFAMEWCDKLWSKPFEHSDPLHNPPTADETAPLAMS